jgi:hypothetical protein
MSITEWLNRYVCGGFGWIMIAAMVTVLYTACTGRTDPAQDAKQKQEMKRIFEAQHGGADAAIRKYNAQQKQAKPAIEPAKPPRKKETF